MTGVELIAAERQRQMYEEGYDAKHDKGHAREIAMAAACYAIPELERKTEFMMASTYPKGIDVKVSIDLVAVLWKWAPQFWKPGMHYQKDGHRLIKQDGTEATEDERRELRRRQLVKAGALIAAAIDALE